MSKSVILVTGASSGFGLMTAQSLAQTGHTVYASMRETAGRNAPQVAAIASWAADKKVDLRSVELDVQSDASADASIAHIIADAGRLDIIVHNAGHMVFGPAEAFTPEQFSQQYDVNVLGTQRVNRAALPHLRRQRKGLLVWVGSSSTRGGTPPFLAPYFAAKAAMDALAVSYSTELALGASRRRSWCRAHLPRAPTISLTPASRQTRRGSPNTKPVPMPALPPRR
jgi:NAD(P)-dependent dehydrogenase (short-subunit alcohol dehydrogenase family)